MTAIEYFKSRNKMTKNRTISCLKCPLADENNLARCEEAEKALEERK